MRTTAGKSFDIVRSADREPAIIDPASSALFLDIDGTLLDIAPTPGAVVVPPLLVPLLRDAQREFGGAVAIITGRRVSEIDSLLSPLKLVVSGVHGCEIRSDPDAGVLTQSPAIDPDLLAGLYELEQKFSGVLIEPKGSGVAVHYRMAPTRWPELKEQLIRLISNRATQIIISPGRKVFEILPAGISKGTALERLLSLTPFAGRQPVMIGDDAGDAPAFDAAIRQGGHAFRVAGEHFPAAVAEFANPAAVIGWLRSVLDCASDAGRS